MNAVPTPDPRRKLILGAIGLFALVFGSYLPLLRTGGFIWDDPQYITENPLLRTWSGLGAIWLHPLASPQYYPLVHTTFWIEYQLVGLHPFLYHIDNLFLHSIVAILLWRSLRRLQVPAAGLAAAIFAVHPINVESVAWITERKNVLSAVFYFLSLRAYMNFAGDDFRTASRRFKPYLISLFLFVGALLSKSVTCSLPAAIVLLIYWEHGKIRWRDLKSLIPFFLIGVSMALVTSSLEKHHVGASGAGWNFSKCDRFLIAGRALWFYTGKILWPHPLIFIYSRWQSMNLILRPWLIAFPISAAGVILALWLLRGKIGRGPLVAILYFTGTILPALGFINIFPMRYSFVADHFQYHAGIGLIVLSAVVLQRIFGRFLILPSCAIILMLGILTFLRTPIYHNQLTLFAETTRQNPTAWMAWGNLGDQYAALSNQPNISATDRTAWRLKARENYQKLYQLAPDEPMSHWKWGIVREYDGDLEAAQQEFSRAIELEPKFVYAMNSLGQLMLLKHQPDSAMQWFRKAIDAEPGYVEPRIALGDILHSAGDIEGAQRQFTAAVTIRPDNTAAQFALANLLFADRHLPQESLAHYAAAIASDPNRADFRTNFAAALAATGNPDQAREQCRIALRIDPTLPQAQHLWEVLNGG